MQLFGHGIKMNGDIIYSSGWHDHIDDDHVHNVSSLCEEYIRQNNNKTTMHYQLLVSNRGSELCVVNAISISIITVVNIV
jgi:hypothetical protein